MDGLKVVKVRNVFKPRWYQIRFRFRLWRATRRQQKRFDEFPPEVQEAAKELQRETERAFLFGDSPEGR